MALSTTYSPRFYNASGVVIAQPVSTSGGSICSLSFSETIATTDMDTIGDLHYCFPLPGLEQQRLHGYTSQAAAMDANASKTLDADLVLIYLFNGVLTTDAVLLYDSSVAGTFQTAIANKYVDAWRILPKTDNGVVHFVWKVNTVSATPAAGNLTIVPKWSTSG